MPRTQTPTSVAATALVEGRATLEGTNRFRKRFAKTHGDNFYRELASGPFVSSLGLGTYLGECDDTEDAHYEKVSIEEMHAAIRKFMQPGSCVISTIRPQ